MRTSHADLRPPDMPWRALTRVTNFTAPTGYAAAAARVEPLGIVRLRGAIKNQTGGASPGTVATVPAAAVPTADVFVTAVNVTSNLPVAVQIKAGTGEVAIADIANNQTVALDGIAYARA